MRVMLRFAAVSSFAIGAVAACAAPPDEVVGITHDALCSTTCEGGTLRGDLLLTPVDRRTALRSDWSPQVSTLPAGYQNGTQSLRADARAHFIAMIDAAKRANVGLVCLSGYRSFQTQCSLFASYASTHGCEEANTFSANAGHSEHQLGTVCDLALSSSGSTFIAPGGPADLWLRAHAHEFGFACSYPNDDASLNDGYVHEPWHYRYLGVTAATALKAKEATLAPGRRLSVPVFLRGLTAEERASLEAGGAAPATGGTDAGGGASSDAGDAGSAPATPSCDTIPFEGRCTGAVLEYCEGGTYRRVDCAQKTDGRTLCGEDPRPTIGKNCIAAP